MEYRLYRLNESQGIVSAQEVIARDDLDALQEAERLCETHAIEVWQGTRCVARVGKGEIPPDTSERILL
jgi:hypothetical protein